MKSSFSFLLMTLAVLDTLFIVMCIWDYSCIKIWGIHLTAYVYLFPFIWYPGKNILLSWTTYLIMAIATERFLAVCRFASKSALFSQPQLNFNIKFLIPRPLIYRSLEATKSYSTRILAYLLPSLLASVLLNIPKFMEAKFVTYEEGVEGNKTVVTVVDYEPSELRRDHNYIYYYVHWIRYLLQLLKNKTWGFSVKLHKD